MGDSDDIKPGIYTFTTEEKGAAAADLEQKRAEILDVLKKSGCFTVTILEENRERVLHSTFAVDVDSFGAEKTISFLMFAALKLLKDIAVICEISMEDVFDMLQEALDQNGEENL